MVAAGHAYQPEVGIKDIFSVSSIGDSVINDERHHNIPSLGVAGRDIFGNDFLPGSVAINSVPGLTSVTPLVLKSP
jgi:hypothetical protein